MVDLSIIIINYNTYQLTSKCIESIYRFTHGLNFEIILVDNASTECDAAIFQEKYPHIILIKNTINLGFAKANNVGIEKAYAKLILLLNSDAFLVDNAIMKSVNFLKNKENEQVGIITGKLTFPDGRIQHNCGRFPSIRLQLVELLRLQKLLSKEKTGELLLGGFFDYKKPVYPDWVWGTFFMFKKEILKSFENEKLSETYFMYMEDMEWCWKIQKKWRIYFDPSIQLIHLAGASTLTFFGPSLNSVIKSNFVDFVIRQKGKNLASIYFWLQRINYTLSRL